MDRINKESWKRTNWNLPRLCWLLIEEHLDEATKEWEPIIEGLGKEACTEERESGLEDRTRADSLSDSAELQQLAEAGISLCGFCLGPSASHMKCGSCRVARYCSPKCQKEAWPAHKAECKRLATASA
ncbi:hypothetical protein BCR35DRAFT_316454 [Leucosporidium creatinivorum]|uniref:MYND-type domain-containing protein n=1 Tax=Leucosporidium creatinivorum TaxID=106004 RepID=A0A1Y2C635_9BASI|nr:hypothetical protein BCR35DRAFT_316454 [Leucosporidium creatinivorum]